MVYLDNEAGASRLQHLFEQANKEKVRMLMSEINLGEVLYITEREKGLTAAHGALGFLEQLPIEFAPANRPRVLVAARLKAHHAMSYADCFAAGLAIEYEACVLTGDSEFKSVEREVEIEWLR
jgi:ribonuclease VapC